MAQLGKTQTTVARWIAFLFLWLACAGTVYASRAFAILKIGPFYILDALFLVGFAFAAISLESTQKNLRTWKPLRWAAAFFAWGVLHLAIDFSIRRNLLVGTELKRVLQHTLISVYPLLWMSAGLWLGLQSKKWVFFLFACVCAISAIPNLFGQNVVNLAAGPLPVVAAVVLIDQALQSKSWKKWALAFLVTTISFLPFWLMAVTYMQRTSFLLVAVTLLAGPFLLHYWRRTLRRAVLTVAAAFGFFLVGLYVFYNSQDLVHYFTSKAPINPLVAMQHGEDLPVTPSEAPGLFGIRARFRIFCWQTAIEDWKANPVFGIGMIPEVPSQIVPGRKNDGGFEYQGAPPVVGPHNSYLTVLARTGLIGLALVFWMIWTWRAQAPKIGRLPSSLSSDFSQLMLWIVPLYGLVYAGLNIGLESPHHAMFLWLVMGISYSWRSND